MKAGEVSRADIQVIISSPILQKFNKIGQLCK